MEQSSGKIGARASNNALMQTSNTDLEHHITPHTCEVRQQCARKIVSLDKGIQL